METEKGKLLSSADEPRLKEEEEEEAPQALCPTALDGAAVMEAKDLPTRRVDVPEWGGHVFVKTLSGVERDSYEQICENAQKQSPKRRKHMNVKGLKALLVVMATVDAEGTPLFKREDVPALNRKSGKAIDRIFQVAAELSGLSEEDIEDLAKNSEGGRSDDSGSS